LGLIQTLAKKNYTEVKMKIGLSLSRCVVDIIEKKVDIGEILVVVTRTDFDPLNDEHWQNIWTGYTGSGFTTRNDWVPYEDREEEIRQIVRDLHVYGMLHQPRQYPKGIPPRKPEHWLEVVLPEDTIKNPGVKKAWDHYKMLAGLS
jgi:hypothetical protein